jgi:hypothetical protein
MLQSALMRAVSTFGDTPQIHEIRQRLLASAAALDYVLLLVSGAAGTRIAPDDAERAISEGCERAVDDLLLAANAVASVGTPAALTFARETARGLHEYASDASLATNDRRFAMIALANA